MYSPDERASIRAEMQRDAAPSPEEVAEEQRQQMEQEGCRECGESDADNLGMYDPLVGNCGAQQRPETVVLCDECRENRATREEKAIESAEKSDDVTIIYECGAWVTKSAERPTVTVEKQTGWTEDGDPIMKEVEMEEPRSSPEVTFETECYCGKGVDSVHFL
jgi:hypothetical protein